MRWSGEKLAERMKRAGLSSLRVADELGVHPDSVENWLNGTEPRSKTRFALAELLGCRLTALYEAEPVA